MDFLSWSTTIVPIYKFGDPMDTENYRTSMIGHTLAKIYGSVLVKDLSTYTQSHELRALWWQVGFIDSIPLSTTFLH